MTPFGMKAVREKRACRDCSMRPHEQSPFALRNALDCDRCFNIAHDGIVTHETVEALTYPMLESIPPGHITAPVCQARSARGFRCIIAAGHEDTMNHEAQDGDETVRWHSTQDFSSGVKETKE